MGKFRTEQEKAARSVPMAGTLRAWGNGLPVRVAVAAALAVVGGGARVAAVRAAIAHRLAVRPGDAGRGVRLRRIAVPGADEDEHLVLGAHTTREGAGVAVTVVGARGAVTDAVVA